MHQKMQTEGEVSTGEMKKNRLRYSIARIASIFCCGRSPNDNVDRDRLQAGSELKTTTQDVSAISSRYQLPAQHTKTPLNRPDPTHMQVPPTSQMAKDFAASESVSGARVGEHPQSGALSSTVDEDPSVNMESERTDISAQVHNENDCKYIMLEQGVKLGPALQSSEITIAPVIEVSGSQASSADHEAGTETSMAVANRSGTFRCIRIHYDLDKDNKRARTQYVMHDTGAACSLTFEGKLKNLNLMWASQQMPVLTSVQGRKFRPLGMRQIFYSYYDYPDKQYQANLVVLKDPPKDLVPSFDILFGRDTIEHNGAITWNINVIGINQVRLLKNSLFTSSPRVSSTYSKQSEETEE